jgi:hypothetical protein
MTFTTKRKKFGIGSLIFLVLFGTAFTAGGIIALRSNSIDPDWTVTAGKVVDISRSSNDGSTTYSPVVSYQVEGRSYRAASNMSSSFQPYIGQNREVAYNPDQPEQSKIVESATTTWWLYLFPIIGIACIVLGPYQYIQGAKRDKKIKQLIRTGLKLQGVLVDVQSEGDSNSNSYKIVVAATDPTGTVQNYVSDSLGGIAGVAMADFRNNPIPIDVYVDPSNHENYYVDISDIPNLTPERIVQLLKGTAENTEATSLVNPSPLVQTSTAPMQQAPPMQTTPIGTVQTQPTVSIQTPPNPPQTPPSQ